MLLLLAVVVVVVCEIKTNTEILFLFKRSKSACGHWRHIFEAKIIFRKAYFSNKTQFANSFRF